MRRRRARTIALKKAAETPGAIAGNELIQAEKQVDAAKALLNSRQQASRAAESAVERAEGDAGYLKITAPFDGVVTDRMVHPGALVGPGNDAALLVIQQVSHLRLVVPVPEEDVGGICAGRERCVQVPAWPDGPTRGRSRASLMRWIKRRAPWPSSWT